MTRPPSESESPRTARLAWTAAFLFTACLCGAALASARIAARWGLAQAAAVAGIAALLLLVTLIRLAVRQRAVAAAAAHRAGDTHQLTEEIKQYRAELGQRAAEQQQLQTRLQRCASELEQREDQRRADQSARSAAMEKTLDQLVRVQLPLAFTGSAVPPPVEEAVTGDGELSALSGHVLGAVSSGAAQLHEQLDEQRETARLAVVALARRVQASAHRIQEEAVRMAERHPADPDVLESSMRVDHAAAQQARHAQSMAVLSGEWPGQQWSEPLALVDVARAAAGRIVAYQRVAVSGDPDVAAAPRVAEPLIHLVAELLANATQSSPPASQVLVTVRTVQRGAVIEIDDGGVGMDEHRLEQARELASGRRSATLISLGEIPQTGLAVVGQYARRHGLGVDLVPSPYGGIRAVTLVPADLVQMLDPAGSGQAREPARPGGPPSALGRATTPAAAAPGAATLGTTPGTGTQGAAAPAPAATGPAGQSGQEPVTARDALGTAPAPSAPEGAQARHAQARHARAGTGRADRAALARRGAQQPGAGRGEPEVLPGHPGQEPVTARGAGESVAGRGEPEALPGHAGREPVSGPGPGGAPASPSLPARHTPAGARPADAVPGPAETGGPAPDAVPSAAVPAAAMHPSPGPGAGSPLDAPTLPVRHPRPAAAGPAATAAGLPERQAESAPGVTAAGLPQRRSRRGQTRLAATRSRTPAPPPAAPAHSPAEAGAWMGAFLGAGPTASDRPAGRGDGAGRRSGSRPGE